MIGKSIEWRFESMRPQDKSFTGIVIDKIDALSDKIFPDRAKVITKYVIEDERGNISIIEPDKVSKIVKIG